MKFYLLFFLYATITPYEVVKRSEELLRGNTNHSIVRFIIDKGRYKRTMLIEGYDDRIRDKFFIRILEPKKNRNITFLKIGNNLWQYLPKIGREIKIASSLMQSSWMGSDFTNDDLVKQSSIVKDYDHVFMDSKDNSLFKIKLTPKKQAPVLWAKIIMYIRKNDFIPVREEFYDHKGRLKRIMTLSDIKVMGERKIPTKYVMKTIKNGKEKSKTIMIIKKIEFNIRIPSYIFSKSYMRRSI